MLTVSGSFLTRESSAEVSLPIQILKFLKKHEIRKMSLSPAANSALPTKVFKSIL